MLVWVTIRVGPWYVGVALFAGAWIANVAEREFLAWLTKKTLR